MPVLFDRMTNGNRENLVLGAENRQAAVPVARHAPAVDHLASAGHETPRIGCRGGRCAPRPAAGLGAPPEEVWWWGRTFKARLAGARGLPPAWIRQRCR